MIHGISSQLHHLLMVDGQHEARRVNADHLQPEHIVLALVRNKRGRGYQVLQELGINFLNLQVLLEKNTPVRQGMPVNGEIPLSSAVKNLLDTAAEEAQKMNHHPIGTEHIVIAYARFENGLLARFFLQNSIFLDDVRKIINRINATDNNQVKQKQEKQSILSEFSTDLTKISSTGILDPVIGRQNEIKRVMQILSRRQKNNPILIGEPGVGKTSIVEGLAAAIEKEQIPRTLYGKKVLALDIASVLAGTKYRGQFEERIKRIIKETADSKNIILFIDELHTLIGTGGTQGALDAANLLKPALARGEIQCIGATTFDEYRKYIEADTALERRFQPVTVREPSKEDTYAILQGLKSKYESHHNVIYSDSVIQKIVELSSRYIPNRFFPDKAIDVLDEVGALKNIDNTDFPQSMLQLEQKITLLKEAKNQAVALQNFEQAAILRDETTVLQAELQTIKENWIKREGDAALTINSYDIAEALSVMTDIPVNNITTDEAKRLRSLEVEMHKTIVGQEEAISCIANAIRRSRAGISAAERPIGSFLFLGPTGVGKTLLAKSLAKFLFGSSNALIRVDMSDFMEKHAVARLIGAPPGYVGFENGGALTEKIRRNPYSVILFDEIEKAHPDIFNILLQVFEEGELKDNRGKTVNFKNTIIIMTGNIGSKNILQEPLGFLGREENTINYLEIKKTAEAEVKKIFSPEFLNRIDSTVVFTPLSEAEIETIFTMEFHKLTKRLIAQNRYIKLTPEGKRYCITKSYDPVFGARPMRRLLQTEIEDAIALKIVSGEFEENAHAVIGIKDEKLNISIHHAPALTADCPQQPITGNISLPLIGNTIDTESER